MEPSPGGVDELVAFWTLLDEDRELLVGKRGATRPGFAMLLKHYGRHGRFTRARADLPDDAVRFVARQVGVDGENLDAYEWSGRTIDYHRCQIRAHLGFARRDRGRSGEADGVAGGEHGACRATT